MDRTTHSLHQCCSYFGEEFIDHKPMHVIITVKEFCDVYDKVHAEVMIRVATQKKNQTKKSNCDSVNDKDQVKTVKANGKDSDKDSHNGNEMRGAAVVPVRRATISGSSSSPSLLLIHNNNDNTNDNDNDNDNNSESDNNDNDNDSMNPSRGNGLNVLEEISEEQEQEEEEEEKLIIDSDSDNNDDTSDKNDGNDNNNNDDDNDDDSMKGDEEIRYVRRRQTVV